MIHRLFAALSVLICVTACGKRIEGQVFIVTAGGPTIKLALVQVKAISKIEMEKHIARIEQQIASERAEANAAYSRKVKELQDETEEFEDITRRMNETQQLPTSEERQKIEAARQSEEARKFQFEKLLARKKALNSATPFFVDLPQPVAIAKTDADGRFELTIPDTGEYVLVASAERSVSNTVERYFWVVRLNSEKSKMTLSNDNLTTSGSPDSVLAAKE